jgi:hypothetical protein
MTFMGKMPGMMGNWRDKIYSVILGVSSPEGVVAWPIDAG